MKGNASIFISIVTVCLNEKERIEQTLLSVINQTYANKELIVIDGASTDGTLEIIKKYEKDITHLISEKDAGIYYAMNKGIALARGDYIIFMNGGDKFYDKDVLFNVFENRSISEDIIYGNACFVFPSTGGECICYFPEKISRFFMVNNNLNHQSTFFRSALLTRLGGFDVKYRVVSDYDFLCRALFVYNCSTEHISLTISYFYKDGISSAREINHKRRNERLKIQSQYFPKPFYYLTKYRYWLVTHKDVFFPKWAQRAGNLMFDYFFKPRNKSV